MARIGLRCNGNLASVAAVPRRFFYERGARVTFFEQLAPVMRALALVDTIAVVAVVWACAVAWAPRRRVRR